jgi:hypothetical protein
MPKNYLHVPNPCTKKGRIFSESNNGFDCNICQKEVIDFRAIERQKVLSIVKENSTPTCGIFKKEQLHQEFSRIHPNLFFRIAMPAIALISNPESTEAMPVHRVEVSHNSDCFSEQVNTRKETIVQKFKISGFVYADDDKSPLPGTTIKIIGTNKTVSAGLDGEFSIEVDGHLDTTLEISFSFIGFLTKTKVVELYTKELFLGTQLLKIDDRSIIGEVIYINGPWKRFKMKVRRLFSSKH